MQSEFLVSAVGQLSIPSYPSIKGLQSFNGNTMHSARWDWSYDLRDKNIGIIGKHIKLILHTITVLTRSRDGRNGSANHTRGESDMQEASCVSKDTGMGHASP